MTDLEIRLRLVCAVVSGELANSEVGQWGDTLKQNQLMSRLFLNRADALFDEFKARHMGEDSDDAS